MNTFSLTEWRRRLALSQRVAAYNLDLTTKGYQELERGARYDSGRPAVVDRRTMLACIALEKLPGLLIRTLPPKQESRQ